MRKLVLKLCLSAAAGLTAGAASANEELIKMSQNPKEWVMPTGNYANHRYSKLNQITNQNAAGLRDYTSLGGQLTVFALPGN